MAFPSALLQSASNPVNDGPGAQNGCRLRPAAVARHAEDPQQIRRAPDAVIASLTQGPIPALSRITPDLAASPTAPVISA